MTPTIVRLPSEVTEACNSARGRGSSVAFVPTMGALHEGHLRLVEVARQRAQFVVCSIFVNPTQFGPNEDFARYPRDLEGDVRKLGAIDLVFAPDPGVMYPAGEETRVNVSLLAASLCGPHRPGHFEGVATVVTKLFNIVGPCVAIFGRKDFQQLAILSRVAKDLFQPVELVGVPTVREADGLAMSSRNAYLTADDRERARSLSRGLGDAARAYASGERRAGRLRELASAHVTPAATSIDYVTVADAETLVPFADDAKVESRTVIAIACRIGATRLIDNVVLGEDPPPA